ncbi:MAG: DUF2807 domain-containing protein [Bacteroidaceae bacterium]|nr:DUF2807 domain-containing protein [Bacteroidaceae bacterium]
MKKMFLSMMLVLAALNMQAGKRVYKVDKFTGLDASGKTNVTYVEGSSYEVVAEGEEKELAMYQVKMNNGVLVISMDEEVKTLDGKENKVRFTVTAPSLNKVVLSGMSGFTAEHIATEKLKLDASGMSSITCRQVEAETVKANISGMSGLNLKADCKDVDLDVSGISQATLQVDCKKLKADVSGISKATLTCSAEETDIDASGISQIKDKIKAK